MKRLFKITGIVLAVLTILLVVLYFYIVNNAKTILQDFVASQSNGKLSLQLKKVKFNAGTLHLEVIEPHFYSNDTLSAFTTYDIRANRLVLELSALKPLIFNGKIFLDTILCVRPQVIVTKWKDQPKENFSLPEQMGKAYTELENTLKNLNINYCRLDSGGFTLVNKLKKDLQPIAVTDFYLQINNLKLDSTAGIDNRYLFTDRIKFYSSHQNIVSSDGNRGIKYSRLRLNSRTQSIELDSCYIYGKKTGSGFNEFGVFFDTLRIIRADLKKITQLGIIKADSAICINPEIMINAEMPEKPTLKKTRKPVLSRDTMEMVIKALLTDIDIRFIGVENASVQIKTKSKDKISTFSSKRSNFSMQDITILNDPAIPIKFGSLSIGVYGYQTYDTDSTYLLSFDSILFKNDRINLSNFAITPTLKNKNFIKRKKISMRSLEIQHLSWLDLLLNKKIVAHEITMNGAEISIIAPEKESSSKSKLPSIYEIFRSMDHLIEVDRLKIVDANIDFYAGKKSHLRLLKVNGDIGVGELLDAGSINDMARSVNKISFAGGAIYNVKNTILLQNGFFNGYDQTLSIGRASLTIAGTGSSAIIEDVRAEKFRNDGDNLFGFENLSWRKAKIEIHASNSNNKNKGKTDTEKNVFQMVLKKLDGRNTSIAFKSDSIYAAVFIDRLQTNNINWDGRNKPDIKDLTIRGKSLRLKKNTLDFFVPEFMFGDQQLSYLHHLKIVSISKKDTVSIVAPNLSFTPNIGSVLNGVPIIRNVILNDPEISFNSTGDTSTLLPTQKKGKLPKLEINQFSILNPVITNLPSSLQRKIIVANQKSTLQFKGIKSDGHRLTIAGFKTDISSFSAETNKVSLSVAADGKLAMGFTDISYSPASGKSPASWSVALQALSARNVAFTTKRNDSTFNEIHLQSLDAENLILNSEGKLTPQKLFEKDKTFQVKNGTLSMVNAKNDLRIRNFSYDNFQQRLSFDSLSVRPALDRDSFNRKNAWAKDYIEFNTGKTVVDGMDPELFFKDSIFYVRKIQSSWPVLQVFKDKRLPLRMATYRELPVSRLQQISKKIQVDSVFLVNTDITYQEINDKTLLTGIVQFKRTNLLVEGLKTFNYSPTDSLKVKVSGLFMDSTKLRLRFSESYYDTLHGFLMHLRLSPFNMTALNPILEPLVSLKIKSGWMDTLHMSAIGREYVSFGKMKMYYSGLKAQYLNKGDSHVKTLKTRLINFAANNLVLKSKNKKGVGRVYTERKREKSIFNYWIKMVLSGAISNTGVRSNKKQEKKYSKSIKKLHVPEVSEVEL